MLVAAVEDSHRGTLHVVLTQGNDTALDISSEARRHLQVVSPAVDHFAVRYDESTGLKADMGASSDPRAVAAAANAQIQSVSQQLFNAGKPNGGPIWINMHRIALFPSTNSPCRVAVRFVCYESKMIWTDCWLSCSWSRCFRHNLSKARIIGISCLFSLRLRLSHYVLQDVV